MSPHILERIQKLVREERVVFTKHARDEIFADGLLIVDVETAILTGKMVREDKGDFRGKVYVIEGIGTDQQTPIGAAVRFNERATALVITAYEIK